MPVVNVKQFNCDYKWGVTYFFIRGTYDNMQFIANFYKLILVFQSKHYNWTTKLKIFWLQKQNE